MADLSTVVDKVRRKVNDFNPTQKYDKVWYTDAIEFAVGKLSHDLGVEYSSITAVPASKLFLVIKLAAIEMCFVRATEEIGDSEEGSSDDVAAITVPDLSVSGPATSESQAATTWLTLAQKLQDEYDGEIEQSGGQSLAAEVTQGTFKKISLTTGGYRSRKLDRGLDAVVVIASLDGATISLEWDILYDQTFQSYQIYRATDSDFSDEERIALITDNHENTYDDESLSPGTYYYKVKTVNPNALKTDSNVVSETVV